MPGPVADEPEPASVPAARLRRLSVALLLAGLIVGWFLLTRRFGDGNVFAVLGPYACVVSLVALALDPRSVGEWMRPRLAPLLIGVAVGLGMTALTYPVFHLASAVWPGLDSHVRELYGGSRSTSPAKALAWMVAIIVAEELLFRGVWPRVLSHWVSERAAYAISLLTYALAQLGTGSLIVALLAAVCGVIWTIQRYWTDSLVSPLIAHLIWTPAVIVFFPVT